MVKLNIQFDGETDIAACHKQMDKSHSIWRHAVRHICEVSERSWAHYSVYIYIGIYIYWFFAFAYSQLVEASSCHTVEALATLIAKYALEQLPIPRIGVNIEKPSALVYVEGAGVSIWRDQDWLENLTPKNLTPKNVTPKNATPKNTSPKNASPKDTSPKWMEFSGIFRGGVSGLDHDFRISGFQDTRIFPLLSFHDGWMDGRIDGCLSLIDQPCFTYQPTQANQSCISLSCTFCLRTLFFCMRSTVLQFGYCTYSRWSNIFHWASNTFHWAILSTEQFFSTEQYFSLSNNTFHWAILSTEQSFSLSNLFHWAILSTEQSFPLSNPFHWASNTLFKSILPPP